MSPDDPRHGERRGYYAHRRDGEEACDACKHAAATAEAIRQLNLMRGEPGRVPALGTVRRLRALTRLGYDMVTLAREIGCQPMMVKKWVDRTEPDAYVFRPTAEKVAAVYERLQMRLPPAETPTQRNAVSRARGRAERNGWPPPLAWDNPDNPNETPTGWQYRPADRADTLADLLDRSAGISEALRVLGVSYDALEKWCERHDRGIWRRLLDNENPHRGGNQHREAS